MFQPHIDGGQLELVQLADVAIGPHHQGERLSVGGKQSPQFRLGEFAEGAGAVAGLIEPV
ncbi:hypothetical protein D3C75_1065700 [compost metagenome]